MEMREVSAVPGAHACDRNDSGAVGVLEWVERRRHRPRRGQRRREGRDEAFASCSCVSKEQQADGPVQGGSVDEGGGGHPHGVRCAQPERKIGLVGVGSSTDNDARNWPRAHNSFPSIQYNTHVSIV
jgi:hypothetical protein